MIPIPLGRYLLLQKLAVGGTAEIFKAKLLGAEGFEKIVAIKRILPHWSANENFISMLVDEAKIMVRLSHERIVQVHELAKEDEIYYIVMEFIDGIDLRKLIERANREGKPLKEEEITFILAEVLRGLAYIHHQKDDQGADLAIVHRDISPQNILISKEGTIKITDFGIAHAASRSYETATGVLKGKFAYMSPEQTFGKTVDHRSDLFATGLVFYELLARKKLFTGNSDLQILEKIRLFSSEEILHDEAIPEVYRPILVQALAPLEKRYKDAKMFLDDVVQLRRKLLHFSDNQILAKHFQELFPEGAYPVSASGSSVPTSLVFAKSASAIQKDRHAKTLSNHLEITNALQTPQTQLAVQQTQASSEVHRAQTVADSTTVEPQKTSDAFRRFLFALLGALGIAGLVVFLIWAFAFEKQTSPEPIGMASRDSKISEKATVAGVLHIPPEGMDTVLETSPAPLDFPASAGLMPFFSLFYSPALLPFQALNHPDSVTANVTEIETKSPSSSPSSPSNLSEEEMKRRIARLEQEKRKLEEENRKKSLQKQEENNGEERQLDEKRRQQANNVQKPQVDEKAKPDLHPKIDEKKPERVSPPVSDAKGSGKLILKISPWAHVEINGKYYGNIQSREIPLAYSRYTLNLRYSPKPGEEGVGQTNFSISAQSPEQRCIAKFSPHKLDGKLVSYKADLRCGAR